MKLLFTPEALASYNEIKASAQREAEQIKDVLKDVLAHPETGKGAPLALTGALAGLWGREYGFCRQIVYQIFPDEVKIYAIGKNVLPEGSAPTTGFQQTSYSEDEYRSVLAQMAGGVSSCV
jgi:Txe/YoeB family toxin of Txe-Axe toxin-antitoxin module